MSGRNYNPNQGPLGKTRQSFEVPKDMPIVNTDGLLAVQSWREVDYKKPILDDILAGYRFDPVTEAVAKRYVGGPRAKAVGREAVKAMIANKDKVIAAGQRQPIHIAENTESTLATFWMIAQGRKDVLEQALSAAIKDETLQDSVAYQAAEAIEDMGHCLYQPFEPIWDKNRKKIVPDERVIVAIDVFAPGVGEQTIAFGKYAADNHDALRTDTGIILMQSALEEQDYRIDAWRSRHETLVAAFPNIDLSMDVLLDRVPLDEMINSTGRS